MSGACHQPSSAEAPNHSNENLDSKTHPDGSPGQMDQDSEVHQQAFSREISGDSIDAGSEELVSESALEMEPANRDGSAKP